jgi:hypothetical protein
LTLLAVRGGFWHGFKSPFNFATALSNCRRLAPGADSQSSAHVAGLPAVSGPGPGTRDPVRRRARTQHRLALLALSNVHCVSAMGSLWRARIDAQA